MATKKNKLLTTLVLLLMAVSGAWAEALYTVTFSANNKTVTFENISLPHEFWCKWSDANGELDQIIQELYGLSSGGCCFSKTSVSGSTQVTAGEDGRHKHHPAEPSHRLRQVNTSNHQSRGQVLIDFRKYQSNLSP